VGIKSKTLKEVCEIIIDCEHKTAPTQLIGYPSIRTPNIGKGRLILDGVNRVSEETYRQWTQRAIPKTGDLILAREAPIGNVAIIPSNLKVCLGQRTVLIRANGNDIVPNYLVYLMLGDEIQAKIHSLSNGATVHHFNMADIRNLELPDLPSLPIQRKIADILSAYDDLIENNTRRIAILEEMAQSLYQEWFVKFRFPGHEKVEMVESEMGLVPEGWKPEVIGNVVQILGGGTPSTKIAEYWDDGNVIWYSPTDLTSTGTMFISDSAKKITHLGLQQSSARLFPAYSVMMTSRATIGVTAINTTSACTNQGFIICIPNDTLSAYQIYHWLVENKQKIIGLASGATFKEINRATFKKLPTLLSDEATSKKFNDMVSPIYKEVENLIARNANLRLTRDLLLPKLISGEIDVSSWVEEGQSQEEIGESEVIVGKEDSQRVKRQEVAEPIDRQGLVSRSLWE
jgi:type I restriction enzyme, S subunit